jgi:acetyl esterase/lipase
MLIMGWLLPAMSMAVYAEDRPRIMKSPHPDVAPTHADVIYRHTGSLELRADVYLPESDKPTAAIAWFAGGGFRLRDKLLVRGSIFDQFHSAESPPALLFHGMGDVVIDYEQSILLQERLNAAGVDAQLVLRTDLVHGDRRFDEPAMSDLITRFLSDPH